MTKQSDLKKDVICVVPHYINSMLYFDKIYTHLINENIEIVYLFKKDKERYKAMEHFCLKNKRKYIIVNFDKNVIFGLSSILRYKLKKKIEIIIEKYEPKLIVLVHGMTAYYDIIIRVAKKYRILSLVLQWAVTFPGEVYLKRAEIKRKEFLKKMNQFDIIKMKIYKTIIKIINLPLYHLFDIYTNHKRSFGQGNADLIGVINHYTKKLLVKQGVNKKKIRVLGSFHFDDALKARNKSIEDIKKKYDIDNSEILIVFFSQPFYKKDITFLTLEKQLNYVNELINVIEKFFTNKGKRYKIFIKLHPIEDLNDYKRFFNNNNVKVISQGNNLQLILLSHLCISQHSTVMQSIIILKKPIISLNIFGLEHIEIASKVVGIKKCISSWKELTRVLEILDNNEYGELNNIYYDRVIMDGKCYYRIIKIIKNMINITKLITNLKS